MVSIPHPLRRAPRALPWTKPRGGRSGSWVVAGFVVLGISAMLPVVQKSTATSHGFTLQAEISERDRLAADIRHTEGDVARLTSQERIQRRATQIGLVPAQEQIYIRVDEPGPEPAKIPAEYVSPPAPAVRSTPSLWQSLLNLLDVR